MRCPEGRLEFAPLRYAAPAQRSMSRRGHVAPPRVVGNFIRTNGILALLLYPKSMKTREREGAILDCLPWRATNA
jgi:hypothetical protein